MDLNNRIDEQRRKKEKLVLSNKQDFESVKLT
jgi:hypothetical protein